MVFRCTVVSVISATRPEARFHSPLMPQARIAELQVMASCRTVHSTISAKRPSARCQSHAFSHALIAELQVLSFRSPCILPRLDQIRLQAWHTGGPFKLLRQLVNIAIELVKSARPYSHDPLNAKPVRVTAASRPGCRRQQQGQVAVHGVGWLWHGLVPGTL